MYFVTHMNSNIQRLIISNVTKNKSARLCIGVEVKFKRKLKFLKCDMD